MTLIGISFPFNTVAVGDKVVVGYVAAGQFQDSWSQVIICVEYCMVLLCLCGILPAFCDFPKMLTGRFATQNCLNLGMCMYMCPAINYHPNQGVFLPSIHCNPDQNKMPSNKE